MLRASAPWKWIRPSTRGTSESHFDLPVTVGWEWTLAGRQIRRVCSRGPDVSGVVARKVFALLELHVERRIYLKPRLTKPFVEHGELRLDEDVEDRAAHRYHLPDAEAERDVVGAVL